MLNNTKINKTTKSQGFTIVELLIVIVVIAILAAITIVAYNGIQTRGKSAAAQSLANSIVKKAEAYNTIESAYPTLTQLTANTGAGTAGNSKEAKLDDISQVQAALPTDEKKVAYTKCTTGAQVVWRDVANSTNVGIGLGGAASTASGAALCS